MEYKIIKVKELLDNSALKIPEYQRPYKWSIKNVNQLIDDILLHRRKSTYRIGTLVLHKDESNHVNIVDGQQRTLTLTLLAHALKESDNKTIQNLSLPLLEASFKDDITIENLSANFQEIKRRKNDFQKEDIEFFLEQCEMVEITLSDVSEAFQFFDAQNARGKDLDPHDLLKAFHLRAMSNCSEIEKRKTVETWENTDVDDLKILFSNYLFRIRNWSKGKKARYFGKNDIGIFKGINLDTNVPYNFAKPYEINYHFVENYNKDYHRAIDKHQMSYPFQIDQVIINGKNFFEMIAIYENLHHKFNKTDDKFGIYKTLNNYEGRDRTGDRYVRNLFDCVVMYYVDKFGTKDLDDAVKKCFIWAYSLRLKNQLVRLVSIDNQALGSPNLFKIIRDAIQPTEITRISLSSVESNQSTKTDDIFNLFKDLGY
jgi:hypothetical protein